MSEVTCLHKTVWMGLCSSCGASIESTPANGEEYVTAPGFISLDSGFRVKRARVLELEQETLTLLKSEKKGVLVFDLDHTLIHVTINYSATLTATTEATTSATTTEVEILEEYLVANKAITEDKIYRFSLPQQQGFFDLKVRPDLYKFLRWCQSRFHLYVYTHGTVPYASVILRAIDPTGEFFGERVIARESIDRPAAAKRLSRIFPTEFKLCLVIDDRRDVWTAEDQDNLIQVAPFLFFHDPDRARISIYGALGLAGAGKECSSNGSSKDGQLKALQEILDKLVSVAFEGEADVRPHLLGLKRRVLEGVRVMTSGIIPTNEADPWSHPVTVTLRELGAVEALTVEEVEVLIASSPHTEKARQVEKLGGKVVRPEYLLYALSTLKTPSLEYFRWSSTASDIWTAGDTTVAEEDDLLNDLLADLS